MKTQGQIVLVTGSTRGLGLAIAHAFHREGARVVLNCTSHESFAASTSEVDHDDRNVAPWAISKNGLVIKADVTDENEVSWLR